MQTTPIDHATLLRSVIAVPPLARDADRKICQQENAKIVKHIEAGGVSSLLYGGNANLYHVRLSEYAALLEMLESIAGDDTWMIPSVGPAYGLMMDQADLLKQTSFPTAMVLPQEGVMTEPGLLTGFRHFVEAFGKPAILYIKRHGYISPQGAANLVDDGLVSCIKYAIVKDDPADDPYLSELIDVVDTKLIVSGIGEQPAITHVNTFGLTGFTSGCVCVAPGLSQKMFLAVQNRDLDMAQSLRKIFQPLEDLRNGINPIRVLHEAVRGAGIADTGPHLPLLSGIAENQVVEITTAAQQLLAAAS